MVVHSLFPQFLLFYESPMMLPNFLNHHVIPQVLVGQIDTQKTFQGILIFPRVSRCILDSRLGFLELGVLRA